MVAAGSVTKTDNNPRAHKAKITIRENVLNWLSEPGHADPGKGVRVFDAFAGSGEMYSAVWKDAAGYTGCDQKAQRDARLMFCADNRRVMRAIDLTAFNVFDFDSYGSPWEQAIILAARRPVAAGEAIGLVLTEGVGLFYRNNGIPIAVCNLTGLPARGMVGVGRNQDMIINKAIAGLSLRMNCEVIKRWQAEGKTGAVMRYIGLVLRGR